MRSISRRPDKILSSMLQVEGLATCEHINQRKVVKLGDGMPFIQWNRSGLEVENKLHVSDVRDCYLPNTKLTTRWSGIPSIQCGPRVDASLMLYNNPVGTGYSVDFRFSSRTTLSLSSKLGRSKSLLPRLCIDSGKSPSQCEEGHGSVSSIFVVGN